MDTAVVPLEDSYDKTILYKSFSERYYTPRYKLNLIIQGEDYCMLFHSNKISVVTLAPTHPLLLNKKSIKSISFKVSDNTDRLNNRVSGKAKKGAQILQPGSPLLIAECTDDTKYTIRSPVPGKLVEVNDQLLNNPSLLSDYPANKGFIAIVLMPVHSNERYWNEMLTPEQYKVEIDKRKV